jgi:hypothetical protein
MSTSSHECHILLGGRWSWPGAKQGSPGPSPNGLILRAPFILEKGEPPFLFSERLSVSYKDFSALNHANFKLQATCKPRQTPSLPSFSHRRHLPSQDDPLSRTCRMPSPCTITIPPLFEDTACRPPRYPSLVLLRLEPQSRPHPRHPHILIHPLHRLLDCLQVNMNCGVPDVVVVVAVVIAVVIAVVVPRFLRSNESSCRTNSSKFSISAFILTTLAPTCPSALISFELRSP